MSSPPFKVKAVFEYTSPHDDDLHFPAGQIITVTEEEDDDWYVGEYVDASGVTQEGLFPRNFVEKYEPTAPPRPTRTNRPKKESEVAPAPAPAPAPIVEPVKQRVPEPEPEDIHEAPAAREPPPAPKAEAYSPPPVARAVEAPPPQAVAKSIQPSRQSAPPPVSEKPSGNSFRDRINAFNKAAPPPAPFKPGTLGSGSNNFIKKPFVAPPPSKNSYVPPPREPVQPQKIYRRDEDPEIARDELENQRLAEQAGLATSPTGGDGDDQPKTTLKERIALLQKQQMEQAGRHADAAAKKEKPKRPAKKRTESHETLEEGDAVALERQNTADTVGTHSMEAVQEEPTLPRRRKSTKGSVSGTPGVNPRRSFGDGNEADMSGAGDTEQEGISTGRDDSDEKPQNRAPPPPVRAPSARAPTIHEPETNEEEGATEQGEQQGDDTEEEDEDDVDPEVRRKEELRARMAKMSGRPGMGMMFGAPMPAAPLPKKIKKQSTGERREYDEPTSPGSSAPPVPMPGMSRVRSPEEIDDRQIGHEDEAPSISSIRPPSQVPDVEDVIPDRAPPPPVPAQVSNGAPPLPGGRPVPPPVPAESRSIPPPTSSIPMSPSAGSESDDELSERAPTLTLATPVVEPSKPPPRNEGPTSPASPISRRASYFPPDTMSPISPSSASNKRLSRLPPPIPGTPSASQPQVRAPPPPPPAEPISRTSTGDHRALSTPNRATHNESEEEITEYEGDYDTDIASAATHKDALKAHGRDTSVDDGISARSPVVAPPPSLPPPLPAVPRSGPPPLPSQPPPVARQSSDMPRAAPPPPPPTTKMPAPWEDDDDEYDPYRYSAPRPNMASVGGHPSSRSERNDRTERTERTEEDIYSASPPKETYLPPPQDRAVPPPPPREAPQSSRGQSRQSVDVHRPSGPGRRSVELSRMSMDSGYVANDVDLAISTVWWTKSKGTPSVYQNRKDILFEFEEHPSKSRSGKALITKELFVLFQDYSQTVITVEYDPKDPKDAKLEQRHEQPPSRLRQDQLEQAHEQFGRPLYDAVQGKKDTVVGDGTPQGLIQELLKPFSNALLPVGTRAYGAVIYANLANASTTQNDEIRPGDIITLRNTKFQGKHGPMHAKYSMDVGKPDHVGIVAEWDGTKKKVRAWEQGRESKKTKMESFKLDDLRSGEVKIWRVMPRSWVGWHGQN